MPSMNNNKRIAAKQKVLDNNRLAQSFKTEEFNAEQLAEAERKVRSNFISGPAPTTYKELHRFIEVVFRVTIPYTACSDETVAPFQWLADVYFNKCPVSFAWANRDSGKTFGTSILHMTKGSRFPGYTISHAAATKNQSNVLNKYFVSYFDDPLMKKMIRGFPRKTRLDFANGSYSEIMTGNFRGVCLHGDTAIETDKGWFTIQQIVDSRLQCKVRSYNFATSTVEWKPIVGWHDNGPEDEFVRLCVGGLPTEEHPTTPKTGMASLLMTRNHLVPKPDGSYARVEDFTKEDEVVLLNNQHQVRHVKFIRIVDKVKTNSRKFDITVADNHNYFASSRNILVKNSGQHPVMGVFDEIETWEVADLEQTWKCPSKSREHDYPPMWVGCSTNQRSFGASNWLINNAEQRGIKLYRWNCFETMEPCKTCIALDQAPFGTDKDRDSICPLWSECRGVKGRKCTGWIKREAVCQDVKTMGGIDSVNVQTQLFCKRPSKHGLVYHNFVQEPRQEGGNYANIDYVKELPFYISHDPAEGKKSVIWFWHVYEGGMYIFDELISEQCPNTMVAKKEFYEYCQLMGYRDPDMVIVDPRKTDAVADWQSGTRGGVGNAHKYKATTPPISDDVGGQSIEIGINETRTAIYDGSVRRVFVNPNNCPKFVTMIEEHHYRVDKLTGEVAANVPAEAYKDESDAFRYGVRYFNQVIRKSTTESLRFV